MPNLFEKLQLLKYERSFCRQYRIKGIPKTFFAFPTNSVEQFNMFVNLASWLIKQSGYSLEIAHEFDDPDEIVANILEALKSIAGYSPEFPASKLKSGSGEPCIRVLDHLADAALKFKLIRYEKDDEYDGKFDAVDGDANLVALSVEKSRISGTASETSSNPERCTKTDLTGLGKPQALKQAVKGDEASLGVEPHCTNPLAPFSGLPQSSSRNHSTIHDTSLPDLPQIKVEGDDWQRELERALPQLDLLSDSGVAANDWQIHIEQFKQYRHSIEKCFEESCEQLKHLEEELMRDINKVKSREKYINGQVKDALKGYVRARNHLNELKEAYAQANAGIAERSATLVKLTEETEKVKTEMEQLGSSMTDSTPVIRIKQAINRLKAENVAMEIRIGVLEHTLLRAQLRAREESQKTLLMKPNPLGAFRRTGENELV
nr:intraflagellar transport protein 57 [Hymenolepis microstoma]CUU97418.1 intraflagellar transport protein 57 [Hymenolepis microstoma]